MGGRAKEEEGIEGLMHPNEEMIYSDAELICGRVRFPFTVRFLCVSKG